MDIKNLYTFKTIVEEGSFINAASVLGYTQSTITFQIRQLEQELDTTLFEKIGRKMVLTQEGNNLLPHVLETIESYEKLKNLGKDYSQMNGELNIILSETIFCYKMQKVISEFHKLAPNIKLKMRSLSCHNTKQALIEGSADIGICYDETEDDDRLIIKSLGNCKMALVASDELVQEKGYDTLDFTKKDICVDTSFITDEPDGTFRLNFEEYVKARSITLQPTIELWSTATIKSMVLANAGVAYLPEFVVQEELKNHSMIELKHEISYEKIRAIYCYHKNKYITPQMELLMKLLEEHVKIPY